MSLTFSEAGSLKLQLQSPMSFNESLHLSTGFELLDENRMPRYPTSDEHQVLNALLPPYISFSIIGPFMVLCFKELPNKPWPISVAGLPLYLTKNTYEMPWKFGIPGKPSFRALEHLDAHNNITLPLYEAVIDYFERRNIQISEVVWIFGFWRVTISDAATNVELPGFICRTTTCYLFEEDTHGPDAARRGKVPTTSNRDDTTYSQFRPGILVASKTYSTSSGILVKNNNGEIFMTVASHGFPDGDSQVFHPNTEGRTVGEVIDRISEADIGLVKLSNACSFENRTFESEVYPDGQQLKGILSPFDVKRLSGLSMDNAFTGFIEAMPVAVSLLRDVFGDDNDVTWVKQWWTWHGHDPRRLPVDGCRGSALIDEDGNVIGFFRYYQDGFGYGPAAYELVSRRYSLCNSSDS